MTREWRWPEIGRRPPWCRAPKMQCWRCEERATWAVAASPDDRPHKVRFFPSGRSTTEWPSSARIYAVTCDQHKEEILDDWCERYEVSVASPLASRTWRYWIASFYWRAHNGIVAAYRDRNAQGVEVDW